jgi:hypothetical protein
MYFLGDTNLPDGVQPPPDTRNPLEHASDWASQFGNLVSTSFNAQAVKYSFNNNEEATREAVFKRIADVKEATGISLENPLQDQYQMPDGQFQHGGWNGQQRNLVNFQYQLTELQRLHPEKAGAIRAHVPIRQDAVIITQNADINVQRAEADAKDVASSDQGFAEFLGQTGAMVRDPVMAPAMLLGGIEGFAAKTIGGRILARAATEAAINGGIEIAVQQRAEVWRKEAGVPIGQGQMWKQVGLAATFGGGVGGLLQGGGEVLRLLGKATPEIKAASERVANGTGGPEDVKLVADALNVQVPPDEMAALSHAIENDANDAAVLQGDVNPQEVAQAVHAIENGGSLLHIADEVDDTVVPVQFRKLVTQQNASSIPDNAISASKAGIAPEIVAQEPVVHLVDDPSFGAFVKSENEMRLSKLEDFKRMNEADIAHLRNDGGLDALPSERDFSNVRAATDDQRISRVLNDLELKVKKTEAAIATGPKYSVGSAAMQVAYAERKSSSSVVAHSVKSEKLGELNSVPAQQAAASALEQARGLDAVQAKLQKPMKRGTLDIMDALPAGTDVSGNAMVTTHAELSDHAARMNELADLVLACKTI